MVGLLRSGDGPASLLVGVVETRRTERRRRWSLTGESSDGGGGVFTEKGEGGTWEREGRRGAGPSPVARRLLGVDAGSARRRRRGAGSGGDIGGAPSVDSRRG